METNASSFQVLTWLKYYEQFVRDIADHNKQYEGVKVIWHKRKEKSDPERNSN